MAGINKVILIGHLGKDPEARMVGELKCTTFTLATSETWRSSQGDRTEHTEWHNIVCWRGLAETAEKYLHKGSKIYVEGKLRYRTYDDQNGVKRYVTEIQADTFTMLDSRQNADNTASQPATTYTAPQPVAAPAQPMAAPASQPVANQQPSIDQISAVAGVESDDDLPF